MDSTPVTSSALPYFNQYVVESGPHPGNSLGPSLRSFAGGASSCTCDRHFASEGRSTIALSGNGNPYSFGMNAGLTRPAVPLGQVAPSAIQVRSKVISSLVSR